MSSAGLASALVSASLLPCCAISAPCVRIWLSIFAMRSSIPERSGDAAPSPRGADFTSLMADASFSPCARVAASSARNAATVFSRASVRAAAAGSGTGLPTFGSSPATRAVRPSMAALSCGAGGAEAGWIAGQPSIQPTPITSAAATAPETGATIQGETGRDGGSATGELLDGSFGDLGRGLSHGLGRRLGESSSSRSTLRSPRGRWSAARASAGPNRAAIQCLRACHRPSQRFP